MRSVATPPEAVNGVAAHAATHARPLSAPRSMNGHAAHATGWPLHAVPLSSGARAVELRTADTFYLRAGKRAFDVIGAAFALIVTVPLMAVMAVLVRLESPGPILYRSQRIGRGGRVFTFYKLRSMVDGAHAKRGDLAHLNECDGPVFKISNDPRVTRIGRWLRRTSIDEIPQFINVLKGEMSLVGPRPPIPEEVARYEPWQLRRLSVRPGLTCLWQISGRSRIGFEEWMRLDLQYIRNLSLWMDLKILLRTIPAVLSRDGAY
jgi:exopolysaccharide biosynthesis polyprenyl glycosylphosphotransferase